MKRGLGRGIDSLISIPKNQKNPITESSVLMIDLKNIGTNKNQPRKKFSKQELLELSNSIKEHGVLQPILVSPGIGGLYTIIAGERRFRASKMANLTEIPVIIKECSKSKELEYSLIENLQREDLNPIEEALCYERFTTEFLFSISDIAQKVSKSKSTISTYISLLKLEAPIIEMIKDNLLTTSHCKLLLSISKPSMQISVAKSICELHLSVKETESLINKLLVEDIDGNNTDTSKNNNNSNKETYTKIATSLKDLLGTKVVLKDNRKKEGQGKIEITFSSPSDLERLLNIFSNIQ